MPSRTGWLRVQVSHRVAGLSQHSINLTPPEVRIVPGIVLVTLAHSAEEDLGGLGLDQLRVVAGHLSGPSFRGRLAQMALAPET